MVHARVLAVPFAAMLALFPAVHAWADSDDDLPSGIYPEQAEPGDWAADFNEAMLACYNGSMGACDAIWLSKRVLSDTYLYNYGRTCGGRVTLDALRQAGAFRLQGPSLHCAEIFSGHE